MKRVGGLSLRKKILLVLTLLPLVMLILYGVIAATTFMDDKIAYVYESSLSVAKTLSSQTTTNLNSIQSLSMPILQEFASQQAFGPISEGIFSSDNPLRWIVSYRLSAEKPPQRLDEVDREGLSSAADTQSLGLMDKFTTTSASSNRQLHVLADSKLVIITEKVAIPESQDQLLFVIAADAAELFFSFQSPTAGKNYLVDQNGQILIGPSGELSENIGSVLDGTSITKTFSQAIPEGSLGIKASSGEDLLVSYARVPFGNIGVVTLIQKAQALKAVRLVIERSILFILVLLSLTVIVSLFVSNGLTAALADLFQATRRVAEGKFDIKVKVNSTDEIGSLASSFNAMAEEVSRLLMETAEKARMESELKTAQTVQETLFPEQQARIEGLSISGFYEPASECGGDWWHYSQVGRKVFLFIGDATGHGAPAALITSAAKSAVTIIEQMNATPAQALTLLNRAVYDVSRGKIMMTFFIASFDLDTEELIYANASHEAPYLMHKSEKQLSKRDLVPLNDVNNPRLGQSRDTQYEETMIALEAGDRIFFYTDGVADIPNPNKQPWGEREFLKAMIQSNRDFPPVEDSVQSLVGQFKNYRQDAPLVDDVTLFMCEYQGKA